MRSIQHSIQHSIQRSTKLPALPIGAGGAPALLFPVNENIQGTPKMHGIMQEVQTGRFRIIPVKPLYCFSNLEQRWYRILMLENGYLLRTPLTPINPTSLSEWADMQGGGSLTDCTNIQWGNSWWTKWNAGRFRYTCTLPAEVVRHMQYHLGIPQTDRLLTGDIWSEIEPMWPVGYDRPYDVSDWLSRCGYGGGCSDGTPLEKVQKTPGTWAEIHAAADKRRDEEREARIAAAVGSEEPLNEIELALGQSLEHHDWTYNYSDCGDTWRRGQNHRDELERGLLALPAERARIVWKAFVHPYYEQYWKCPI